MADKHQYWMYQTPGQFRPNGPWGWWTPITKEKAKELIENKNGNRESFELWSVTLEQARAIMRERTYGSRNA